MDDPTRGVDVGAKYEIYKLMNEIAEKGVAIIMISSELEEVLGMSDRVMVMCEGHSNGTLNIAEATQEKIMALATGIAFEQDFLIPPCGQTPTDRRHAHRSRARSPHRHPPRSKARTLPVGSNHDPGVFQVIRPMTMGTGLGSAAVCRVRPG